MNLASKTRPGLLVGLAVIGGVLAWCAETWLVTSGRAVMAPPLTMPLTLVVLAGLLLWLAWPIRAYTRRLWRERREAESRRRAPGLERSMSANGADRQGRDEHQAERDGSGKRVDPQYAFRVLAFARAASLASSLMAGVGLGVLVFALTRTVPPEEPIWHAVFSLVGSLVLLTVGLVAESWCRIPPGGEETSSSQNPVAA
ncbi:hypothetical protein C5B85_16685 [Pseudoclavibacter sp. AY1F1]|uniref:DUF3180 domain-containing protein n=1 Tax=Pseudoclavibacter sp. AY1F1 TaxID=2080583 RepID=UPI000CE7620A|nr:DUF3180 domain-containing protein [Pseudoclavibacter sp. AY1F1]PPF42396.1 hypothetical protein C5B85_16685 [Pseudoclavibacter sp. AY1F1]